MKQHPEREDLVLCDDLLAPEGYGEIIGGSQREDSLDLLLARIREEKAPRGHLQLVPLTLGSTVPSSTAVSAWGSKGSWHGSAAFPT